MRNNSSSNQTAQPAATGTVSMGGRRRTRKHIRKGKKATRKHKKASRKGKKSHRKH